MYTPTCPPPPHTHMRCSIGGATGYRVIELTGLTEGSTLIVGGKEVEVHIYVYIYIYVLYMCDVCAWADHE